MKKLNENELIRTNGGGSGVFVVSVVAGIVTFVIGVLSGYSNPVKCNN